ncbi:unnamed protein product [Rotaria socialis]|uniref:Uncharacterized protein n=1 Tax=Rotaria socialis TaxID=392032 RepID=A0A821T7W8_9BILA|nr:unnamed protein product [Rotaria socialis]
MNDIDYIRNLIVENEGRIRSIEGELSQEEGKVNNSNLSENEKQTIEQSIHALKQRKQDYIIAIETLQNEMRQLENKEN